ncbi:MAG: aminotransferase class V-fold PLP-dependent enzyme [Bacteroidales bacterium]|jgi:cysteine desulfurase|nr:aminotransferase class V-fold PLP-dependent enzyme [Bacteroidales bacterium]
MNYISFKNDINQFIRGIFNLKHKVYLDHNATTPISSRVRRKMDNAIKQDYGNPSSIYYLGRRSYNIIENARKQVANAISANYQDVIFTGSATEANNAVINSLNNYFFPLKKKIVSTPIEHSSIIGTLDFLKTKGIEVSYCPVDRKGRVIIDELEKLVDKNTFLICCMMANNEIGTIQDIPAIVEIARRNDIKVLTDCVQALGKIPIDVSSMGVDYATFSAHKIYGPKGIGALYIREGSPFSPFIQGGQQEGGMRAGTENIHNIVGFGVACQDIGKLLSHMPRIQNLKDTLISWFREIKKDMIVNMPDECLPNTINITFPDIDNTELLSILDSKGISVSIGSACNSKQGSTSHVLKAIGLTNNEAQQTIRISLGLHSSKQQLRYVKDVFAQYFEGRIPNINRIDPNQLTESLLFNDDYYILDVRPEQMRKMINSLPNSNQLSIYLLDTNFQRLPKNKEIIVVCLDGGIALAASYIIKANGFNKISILSGGILGWQQQYPDLVKKYADYNNTILEPEYLSS